MAGHSGTPLVNKLAIKQGHRVSFPSAPEGFLELLGELPMARELGLANRLVDNNLAAIDETWPGLRLVIRLEDRPGQPRRP